VVNVVIGNGDRHDNLLRFSMFPIGDSNFIKIKYEVGWTALKCFVHTAYRIVSSGKIRGTCKRRSSCGELFFSVNSAE
jgi:hypothetical protein